MKYKHVFLLMQEAQLSPEQLARRMGLSGMTLRRWQRQPRNEELPPLYDKVFVDVVYELVAEGQLGPDMHTVRAVTTQRHYMPSRQAIAYLGCSEAMLREADNNPKRLIDCLAVIGANRARQTQVEHSRQCLVDFKKLSMEWTARITRLCHVIGSQQRSAVDKLVAYGALFYLLTPFDLIPDAIPVFGLMDDFVVLGAAVAYYTTAKQRESNGAKR